MSHPDLAKKFGYYPSYDLAPLYEEMAEAARAGERMVEVNTSGGYYACAEMFPAPALLQIALKFMSLHRDLNGLDPDALGFKALLQLYDLAFQRRLHRLILCDEVGRHHTALGLKLNMERSQTGRVELHLQTCGIRAKLQLHIVHNLVHDASCVRVPGAGSGVNTLRLLYLRRKLPRPEVLYIHPFLLRLFCMFFLALPAFLCACFLLFCRLLSVRKSFCLRCFKRFSGNNNVFLLCHRHIPDRLAPLWSFLHRNTLLYCQNRFLRRLLHRKRFLNHLPKLLRLHTQLARHIPAKCLSGFPSLSGSCRTVSHP